MNRRTFFILAATAALVVGWLVGEVLARTVAARDLLGRVAGRGRLLAIASGTGIYERDIDPGNGVELADVIVRENLRYRSRGFAAAAADIDREAELLRSQFAARAQFDRALHRSGLTITSLRNAVAERLRALVWIEKELGSGSPSSDVESAKYYAAHQVEFDQPARVRVAHLFLAAHTGTAPDVAEAKRKTIEDLSRRISAGADFAQLVRETSEDEATKARGGDLGFLTEWRTPEEFYKEVSKLKVGETTRPLRTHLGFHIARVAEVRAARRQSFDEARTTIAAKIANASRADVCTRIRTELSAATLIRALR